MVNKIYIVHSYSPSTSFNLVYIVYTQSYYRLRFSFEIKGFEGGCDRLPRMHSRVHSRVHRARGMGASSEQKGNDLVPDLFFGSGEGYIRTLFSVGGVYTRVYRGRMSRLRQLSIIH